MDLKLPRAIAFLPPGARHIRTVRGGGRLVSTQRYVFEFVFWVQLNDADPKMDALKGIGHACGHNLIGMSGKKESLPNGLHG